jgi:hypothetical protein
MKTIEIVGSDLKGDNIVPFLLEVELSDHVFLRVKETLTRIGIPSKKPTDEKSKLIQTAHILSKRGKFYICHYKTMFLLDGKSNHLTTHDIARQNRIAQLLQDWGLLRIVRPDQIGNTSCSLKTIKVVKYDDRDNWEFVSKYDVGAHIGKL